MGPGSPATRRSGPAAVPSCEIVERRVVNFALYDLDGQPWEFRQHSGKLILLDFWGTWCGPCLKALPHVRDLARRYGAYGLEVVGIACEDGAGPEALREVAEVARSKNLNYRVLLAENFRTSPVVTKFQIRQYPTLILLDDAGNILARAEGAQFQQIEGLLQQRLGRRP
jgi:thiol-disulfide isomerase/thioredoxin